MGEYSNFDRYIGDMLTKYLQIASDLSGDEPDAEELERRVARITTNQAVYSQKCKRIKLNHCDPNCPCFHMATR